MPETKDAKGVEAVERALTILDCFNAEQTELSLADVAKQTGLYKSTILRLAVSLEKFGYVVRSEGSRFRLGAAAWRLGANYRESFDLATILRPELKWLCDATHETAAYYVREGNARVCLFRCEPSRAIRHYVDEGQVMPLGKGATGRVLLAFSQDQGEGDAQVRKAGFAKTMGERDKEVAAIAVPVIADTGQLHGALAVSGLITRFTPDRHDAMLAALKESQHRLLGQIAT